MPIVTLTTDFGTVDHYVASMKGVIWSIAPETKITDVTHEIPPQDIGRAAFVLRQVWSLFPPGSVHVAVVDPGVGSDRAILLGRYADRFVIAPDNGLVTWIHRDFPGATLRAVENADYFLANRSRTFDGRDIMAPVAGHLVAGVPPERFGPVFSTPRLLAIAQRAERVGSDLRGVVIHVDRFGNLLTNIAGEQLADCGLASESVDVVLNGRCIGSLKSTFSEVAVGEPVAMIGSTGFIEVCVRDGSAAEQFALGRDAVITVRSRVSRP